MSDRVSFDDPLYGDLVAPCEWCGAWVLDIAPNYFPRLSDWGWRDTLLCLECASD